MSQSNKDRVIEISKKLGLTHIGSNLSCLPVLEEIYEKKRDGDIVILDNAHAHLAHLVVKHSEDYMVLDRSIHNGVEYLIEKTGIHCDRKAGCDASGGSLGHGLGIAIGYALADRTRDVYVIVSDGSMMEGSNWEALRIASDLHLDNLRVHCNFNGFTAVSPYDPERIWHRMNGFFGGRVALHKTTNALPELDGVKGHYEKL